jgi:excisionase family DNA binding protein
MAHQSDLLTVEEAAHALTLRPGTVRAWILQRKIPVIRVGRSVRVRRSLIEDLFERNSYPADKRVAV